MNEHIRNNNGNEASTTASEKKNTEHKGQVLEYLYDHIWLIICNCMHKNSHHNQQSLFHVDIVALQSTWLADSGNIKEAYYLFLLWQSKKEDEMLGFL